MGFVGRLWRGEVSLAVTFWIFFAVVTGFFRMLEGAPAAGGGTSGTAFAVSLAYYAFITVAVWRSSLKYRGPAVYPILAQGVMVLGWLHYAWRLLTPLLFQAPGG